MKLGSQLLFFATILFMSLSSFAGDEVCNGGDVVVCPDGSVRLLDLIERGIFYGLSPLSEEFSLSATRSPQLQYHLQEILAPLQGVAPEIHECLNSYLENDKFFAETRFVSSVEFVDVKDEIAYAVPKNCHKEQVAMQFKVVKPYSGYRYFINEDLWKKMNDFQRASLVIHEVILRNFLLNPQWTGDTTAVRYLTGFMISQEAAKMSPERFKSVLEGVSFTCTKSK
jgi:hypothetical protein